MFHVKICGVTTGADARMVAEAGADCIGLNFVVGSPRRLVGDAAAEVAAAVPRGVLRVGVFAGTSAEEILRMAAELSLDAVQLHGHLGGDAGPVDPPERCGQLAGLQQLLQRKGTHALQQLEAWRGPFGRLGQLGDRRQQRVTAVSPNGGHYLTVREHVAAEDDRP